MTAPQVFDRTALRQRRARARALGPVTFLLDRAAADLADRLATILRRFARAADLFAATPLIAETLLGADNVASVVSFGEEAPPTGMAGSFVVADAEVLPIAEQSIDLAVSILALQTVNDLPGALLQIRRALKPDGLFLAALFGGDTLTELRQAFAAAEVEVEEGMSPRVAPFADVRDLGALLQRAGFALPVTDVDRAVVRYASPVSLLDDLRRMGATNPLRERRRTMLKRRTWMRAMQIYAERFSDPDGRVRATFDIVWLSGWSPHASQQQPLKPGSARTRLADALGTHEISAGEKAGR